jgi:hypothetical protein
MMVQMWVKQIGRSKRHKIGQMWGQKNEASSKKVDGPDAGANNQGVNETSGQMRVDK